MITQTLLPHAGLPTFETLNLNPKSESTSPLVFLRICSYQYPGYNYFYMNEIIRAARYIIPAAELTFLSLRMYLYSKLEVRSRQILFNLLTLISCHENPIPIPKFYKPRNSSHFEFAFDTDLKISTLGCLPLLFISKSPFFPQILISHQLDNESTCHFHNSSPLSLATKKWKKKMAGKPFFFVLNFKARPPSQILNRAYFDPKMSPR